MPILLYQGEKPSWDYEAKAVRELAAELRDSPKPYLLLTELSVRGQNEPHSSQLDLLIIGEDRICLVELKDASAGTDRAEQPVRGGDRGPWHRADGMAIKGQNPVVQVIDAYWNLREWLFQHRGMNSSPRIKQRI